MSICSEQLNDFQVAALESEWYSVLFSKSHYILRFTNYKSLEKVVDFKCANAH